MLAFKAVNVRETKEYNAGYFAGLCGLPCRPPYEPEFKKRDDYKRGWSSGQEVRRWSRTPQHQQS